MAPPHPTTRPPASYKMKLAQDTLYGHNDRDDKETEESVVGGSEEEKKRELPSKRPNKIHSWTGFYLLARTKRDKRMQVRC